MKLIKFTVALTLISGLLATQIANATTLHVTNLTNSNLAFTVNGVCSSEIGTVPAHGMKKISKADFNKACGKGNRCLIQSYENTCYKTYISDVLYDKKQPSVMVSGRYEPCIITRADLMPGELALMYSECVKKK